jgi:2-polyprenyl-3-methyl-5-hydroxy-6-metoxy-1,4-benzoquinol methylase/glycosyltransferase involved in cell wall biosynthesis
VLRLRCPRTLFISGWLFDERRDIDVLQMTVNGAAQPVIADHMPRPDIERRYADRGADVTRRARHSGFWAVVTLGDTSHRARLGMRLTSGGIVSDFPLHEIDLLPLDLPQRRHRALPEEALPLIAICLATYNPTRPDFERQIASIRRQTYDNWVCVVNDDASTEQAFGMVRDVVGADERFTIHRNEGRLGFYRNFAVCLLHAPADARYIALSDQDDNWYPDKLATLITAIRREHATLAYSDMRIVSETGQVLQDSFWRLGRRNNRSDLGGLLCANSVTGAASLFNRDVLDVALPFPAIGGQYHDHWIACVALALGKLAYVDRPLHDYVQHPRNVLGHRGRPGPLNSGGYTPANWYFTNVMGSVVFSRELLLRAADRITEDKRRVLSRVADLDTAAGRLWLAEYTLRRPLETRGPKMLAATLWRWMLAHVPLPVALSMTEGGMLQWSDAGTAGMVRPAANGHGAEVRSFRYHRGRGTHQLLVNLVPENAHVLDVGCAAGYLGVDLQAKGCRVTGIELDPLYVAAARETAAYETVVELDLDDASAPLPEGPFDIALCADVLEHLRQPLETLRRLATLVRPGGQVLVSLPNVAHVSTRLRLLFGGFTYTETGTLDSTHLHLYTYRTARELVEAAGLTVTTTLAGSDHFGRLLSSGPAPARALRGLLAYNVVLVCRKTANSAARASLDPRAAARPR